MSDRNFTKRGTDYPIIDGFPTLPGNYYHDENIYREELDKIFYTSWILACRAEEIPKTGDFRKVDVGDESILIVRNKQGEIKAHFNVCRHRGTQLCNENAGTFKSKSIQCPYHAWTYGLDGELMAAPMMTENELFQKSNCSLHPVHVFNWEGFVFISLAIEPVPFEQQMGVLIGKFGEWNMSELRIAKHIHYELQCNWKLILQNYQECYHCPGVHPLLSKLTPFQSAQHDSSKGSVIGGYMELTQEGGSMTMNGEAAAPHICSSSDKQRVYYYSVYPNMLLTPHPDFVMYHHITPLGPERIVNDCYWLFDPAVIADSKHQEGIASAVSFWDLTNRQDWEVCEQMQKGTASKRFTRGYYSGREDILYALDRELLKNLGHTDPEAQKKE